MATPSDIKSTLSAMSTQLKKIYTSIVAELSATNQSEIVAKFNAGKYIFEALSDIRKYGEHAVENLSTALNVSPAYLYNLQTFYTQWKEHEQVLYKLAGAESKINKTTISFSHLMLLTALNSIKDRVKLAQRVIEEAWSVVTLKDYIHEQFSDKSSEDKKEIKPKSPLAGCTMLHKAIDNLEDIKNKVTKSVITVINNNVKTYQNDEKTIAALKDIRTKLDDAMASMHTYIEDIESVINKIDTPTNKKVETEDDSDDEATVPVATIFNQGTKRGSKLLTAVNNSTESLRDRVLNKK